MGSSRAHRRHLDEMLAAKKVTLSSSAYHGRSLEVAVVVDDEPQTCVTSSVDINHHLIDDEDVRSGHHSTTTERKYQGASHSVTELETATATKTTSSTGVHY